MKNITMVDLKSQYEKIKTEIDQSIQQVIDNTAFINGPAVKNFEENLEKYLGVKHIIPCANGTDALQIALMALGLKPGDEVITSSFTFVATVEVIALLGLKPVFVDVHSGSFNINEDLIEKAITTNTKAIIPVHLFGQTANMEKIMDIAKRHNIYVVEDNCQAIGSDYIFADGTKKKAGSMGDIGCTSFFPSKNLGCYGDGGAIFTNNDELADKLTVIVNHGMKVRYYHDEIGVNSRLDSIQAAVLNVKLKYLDKYCDARRQAADYYDNVFSKHAPKLTIPERSKYSTHVFHQYTLKLEGVDRSKFQEYMQSKNVPAMIYYPVPLHLQKAYEAYGLKKGSLPVTEKLSEVVVSLPMHTELDNEQLKHITDSVVEFINK